MKINKIKTIFFGTTSLFMLANVASAQDNLNVNTAPSFASVFTNNAVLQRDKPVSIWGTSKPDTDLIVKISNQTLNVKSDSTGKWKAIIAPISSGNNYILSVSDGTKQSEISNIAFGDVFLCSGQSNMEFQQKYATNAYNDNQANNPNLRFINIEKQTSLTPRSELEIKSAWKSINPQTIGDASSVCYHMADAIYKSQKVTIGMINSSWGGTAIETWISQKNLGSVPEFKDGFDTLKIYANDKDKGMEAWTEVTKSFWANVEPDGQAKQAWKEPSFNDKDWGKIGINNSWESQDIRSLSNFDGIVWYRGKINLTQEQAANANRISFGPIDDADLTYINGQNIGNTNGWNAPRNYKLPKNIFQAGENTIAIRVIDYTGGGGLYGAQTDQYIELLDGQKIPLNGTWKYKISAPANQIRAIPNSPWDPITGIGILNNAMITPIAPYTLKGVAWYQGESNTGNAAKYDARLKLLFKDWREQFNDPKLPFFIVQLANYGATNTAPIASSWAHLRDAQRIAVTEDANAGLAVSVDIGDRYDIHPTQKAWVGKRLAKSALSLIYKQEGSRTGPIPVSATRTGNSIKIDFAHTAGKLIAYSYDKPIGFEICGIKCEFIDAKISGNSVILTGPNAAKATKVRYAWSDAPVVNLYSYDDLPITPFEMSIK